MRPRHNCACHNRDIQSQHHKSEVCVCMVVVELHANLMQNLFTDADARRARVCTRCKLSRRGVHGINMEQRGRCAALCERINADTLSRHMSGILLEIVQAVCHDAAVRMGTRLLRAEDADRTLDVVRRRPRPSARAVTVSMRQRAGEIMKQTLTMP